MVKKKTEDVLAAMAREQQQETEHKIRARKIDNAARWAVEKAESEKRIAELEREIEDLRDVNALADALRADPSKPYKLTRTERSHKTKEAVACLMLSDLHFEERVDPREVNGLNEYNLEIAVDRCDRLLVGFDWYLQTMRARATEPGGYKIRKLFVPCLGDNVTNWLHGDEDSASNFLTPNAALLFAKDRLIQIFDGLLAMPDVAEVFAPIIPGNHDRMPGTRKNPHRGRTEKSLAVLLAAFLNERYRDEPRISFELSYSANHYTDVFGHDVRSMHGDGFGYNRGVGGIYVGARRYIGSLNTTRPAAVTLFGHHHQHKVDANWVSNTSLIGYTAYSANLGYEFEPAGQVALLFDRDRGKRFPVNLQVQKVDSWA